LRARHQLRDVLGGHEPMVRAAAQKG
jgi:hypothetical protein